MVMTSPTDQGLDPQTSYTDPQWELLRCCLLRTLMTYQGVPDIAGTHPVPDLATASPSVSPDGMTWTFHLREGVHYAPPLQDVQVTAGDVVRALLRTGSADAAGGPGVGYLSLIEGFSEYADGKKDAIDGVSTPDEFTLQIQETRPDTSIVHLFAMPFTSPIPPLPGDPNATLGAATGHPFVWPDLEDPPAAEGYGRFLVATGPYMFEGAGDLELTVPPRTQAPISGFTPGWGFGDVFLTTGRVMLVRDPSWDPVTDPNRAAFPDRIEISIVPSSARRYAMLEAGTIDAIVGEDPPPSVLSDYRATASLSDRIFTTTGATSRALLMNTAQPPFDDVHVRRALALALDHGALAEETRRASSSQGPPVSHVVPDPMEGSFLASWNVFATPADPGSVKAEMDASGYGIGGKCSGPVCRGVAVVVESGTAQTRATLEAALAEMGIVATFPKITGCSDPRAHVALCSGGGWTADYPDAGNMFTQELASCLTYCSPSLLGATPDQLRGWGYSTRRVPSIESDYRRCAAELGVPAAMCWARLDQLLVDQLVVVIPLLTPDVVRLAGANVVAFSVDQAFGEPSLDRIAVSPAASSWPS